MRDELDARIWVDNHDALTETIDRAVTALGRRLGRFADWDGSSHQLLALVTSFVITALSFGATT